MPQVTIDNSNASGGIISGLIMVSNVNTISTSVSTIAGQNSQMAGPVTISDTGSLTIVDNSALVIVG